MTAFKEEPEVNEINDLISERIEKLCGILILGAAIWIRVSKDGQEFFIGLLLILLLQVAAGILGATFKSDSERVLNETLHENIKLLSGTDEEAQAFQKALMKFQEKFKCCGLVNGAADWGNHFQNNYMSCECPGPSESSCVTYEGKYVYQQPCISFIKEIVAKHSLIVIGIAFGLVVIEVQYNLALLTLHSFPCFFIN
ncbi:hypothetical protein GH733_006125 [Mirounga leonina]|nr:hypothetical protein GH733_006125 [Mirounga leonina]